MIECFINFDLVGFLRSDFVSDFFGGIFGLKKTIGERFLKVILFVGFEPMILDFLGATN
jgi:hypothetical protein